MFGFTRRRRARIRKQPFADAWIDILKQNMPIYERLTEKAKAELRGHIQVFVHEKQFEGCGGFEMTDEVRVTIASQACLLLLNRETDYYPQLKTILVYPSQYFSVVPKDIGGGIVTEVKQTRLGESWHRGPVVLSWDDVRRGAVDPRDGKNVALHEFAHQLDSEYGDTDGAPALSRPAMFTPWARVLQREYDELREDMERHRKTYIDKYGATNPAEFFAVVTEMFFEQPRQLNRRHPELYEQFKLFYQQDPLNWTRQPK